MAIALLAGASALGRQNRTAAAPLAPPPVDFAPPVHYNVGGGTKGLVTGDFNKDGFLDLAGVQWGAGRMFVQLNAGNGAFLPYSWYSPNYGGLWELATGDLNNDGNLDLVTADRQYGAISVFLGTGSGTFTFLTTQGVGAEPSDVELADFNQDGRLDLAIGYFYSSSIRVLPGLGNGTFGAGQAYLSGAGANNITMADLNANGTLDLVVANRDANSITVIWGGAAGAFSVGASYPVGNKPESSAVGDINGDGNLDIAVANRYSANISLFTGDGAQSFTFLNTIFGQSVDDISLKDLNSDGSLDVITGNGLSATEPGTVSVDLGNGDGTFVAPLSWASGVNPSSHVVADFNRDGLFDIATANYHSPNGNDVSILYGRPVALPTATATATAATATATATSTATATATATSTATATATLAPTVTATPPAATATTAPGAKAPPLYLPLIANTRPRLLLAINPVAIATRPVAQAGEVYYTTAFTLSAPLPAGGRFYLSAAPDSLTPVLVDDELAITVNGAEVYTSFLTDPRVVELPRSLLESWTGLTITVVFRDAYGSVVGSTPVWLIWQP